MTLNPDIDALAPDLVISVDLDGSTGLVHCAGRLDERTGRYVLDAVGGLLGAAHPATVLVDLSDACVCDGEGEDALAAIEREAVASGSVLAWLDERADRPAGAAPARRERARRRFSDGPEDAPERVPAA